jgi:hypothetical protein
MRAVQNEDPKDKEEQCTVLCLDLMKHRLLFKNVSRQKRVCDLMVQTQQSLSVQHSFPQVWG